MVTSPRRCAESVLDDGALGAVLGRVDAATSDARNAIVDALRNIHGVLDDTQRDHLADLRRPRPVGVAAQRSAAARTACETNDQRLQRA